MNLVLRRNRVAVLVALVAIVASVMVAFTSPRAQAESVSEGLTMSCSFTSPSPSSSPFSTTISLSAPDSVEPGESFSVTARTSPMVSGPAAAAAGDSVVSMILDVSGSAGFSLADQRTSTWANTEPIDPFATFSPGSVSLNIVAPTDPQDLTITFDQTQIFVGLLSTYLNCWAWNGSSRANPSITVSVEASTTTTTGDTTTTTAGGDTTTTTAGGDTTTTTAGGDTTTTTAGDTTTTTGGGDTTSTSAADTTTTTGGGDTTSSSQPEESTTTTIAQADTISKSASVTYGCTPFVSGSNLGTENATQSITFSAPDRVNPGDDFTVTIKMSPGPESGPIPLAAGTQQFRAKFKVSGGGSPSTVSVSGGSNSSDIAPNSIIRIPAMRGKVTATGAVGDTISYAPSTFTIDSPSLDARTVCEPTSSPAILSTQIVAEPVNVSSGGSLPNTGLSDYVVPLAIALFALYVGGLALSTLPRQTKEETKP